ncbi:MAG: hypothetical protein IT244_13545 [Bacteroidia bacterium]|nr:hypothetical protein [Bacteroidia bacterium]
MLGPNSQNRIKFFLFDGIGACISTFFLLGFTLFFNKYFGLPQQVLLHLTLAATFIALFSLSCFLLKPKKYQIFMGIIIGYNIIYCIFTLFTLIENGNTITPAAIGYFTLEILIILIIINIEWYALKNKNIFLEN